MYNGDQNGDGRCEVNPALLLQLLSMAQQALAAVPSLVAEYNAIKSAGSATAADLAALGAQIAALDAARVQNWAAADAALDAAAKT